MGKLYTHETIEDLNKELVDKSIIAELVYELNNWLLITFGVIFKSIMIVLSVICMIVFGFKYNNPKISLYIGAILIASIIVFNIIMKFARFYYYKAFNMLKCNLLDTLLARCKEFNETKYEEWQVKQILKKAADIAFIEIDFDKVK